MSRYPFMLFAVAAVAALVGCDTTKPPRVSAEKETGEPTIRVRIRRSEESIRFTGPTRIQVYPKGRVDDKQLLGTPVEIQRIGGEWSGPWSGRTPRTDDVLVVEPLGPTPLSIAGVAYPGGLRLVPVSTTNAQGSGFDVVNHVRLEAYLPGVLDRELYDDWKPAAYLAQAVAARSYAIDQMSRSGAGRHYDVENTQASQAYAGHTSHPLAAKAVADTMGLVLTHHGKIIPAYYSSTCGGMAQSPVDAFGADRSVPPLDPHEVHDWCKQSKYYRWGPVERDRETFSQRIKLWAKKHGYSLANMGTIRDIRIDQRNALGRPSHFEIIDNHRKRYGLRAEQLRFACNHQPTKKNLPAPESTVRSSHFRVKLEGDTVRIIDGRGFGHGVGLCQYGAEGMARAGHGVLEILAEYYRGAEVERAY